MVYDYIYFHDELDLLDARLHELNDVVDKFIIVEFSTTVTGKKQPLYYEQNKERFKEFHDKIIHYVWTAIPKEKEYGLGVYRDRLNQALFRVGIPFAPDDIILIVDPDVILKKETVEEVIACSEIDTGDVQFICHWFVYYMDTLYSWNSYGFCGAVKFKNIGKLAKGERPIAKQIISAGSHFSKLGGTARIMQNLDGYPHQDMNIPAVRANMEQKVQDGVRWDDCGRGGATLIELHYDASEYPTYIIEHPEIYAQYFKRGMNA